MNNITVGFAMCGSFCTFEKVIPQMKALTDANYKVIPIMSETAYNTDTRFGSAESIRAKVTDACQNEIIHTIRDAEPIGPKKLLDLLIVAPCTGNTLAKLANGITDSCVTLATKAHLRNMRPVLLGVSSNDALSTSAQNIGKLMNSKNIFFIPMCQDDHEGKPNSLVADFTFCQKAVEFALQKKQLQPMLIQK